LGIVFLLGFKYIELHTWKKMLVKKSCLKKNFLSINLYKKALIT